jgi:hypothetical protein
MQQWRAIPVAIGGVVAVGFLDEDRIIVGSHSGVGVFDVHTGERIERTHDEDYNWYQGDPPFIRRPSAEGVRLIRAAGLWGGDLDQSTTDGWTCYRVDGGAVLSADGHRTSESRTRKSTARMDSHREAVPSCTRHRQPSI